MIPTRHFSWQMIPAFAIDMVCCSITSSSADESEVLSNSSIAQTPLSANMSAPASKDCSLFYLFTVTVRPVWDIDVALTYTLWGNICTANFNNWDLPMPGSPNNNIWLVYLKLVSWLIFLDDPPTRPRSSPALTSSWPKIVGQKDLISE